MPKISGLTNFLTGAATAANDLYVVVDVSANETKKQTKAEAAIAIGLPSYVPLAGGELTGPLILADDPSDALEAVTKQYVDGLALNLGKRQTVRVTTTANIVISTALNSGDVIDGVTLATSDLVLVKNQSTAAQNGIYMVEVVPVRSTEFDTYDEHPGSLIAVQEGTAGADTIWLCTSNAGGTLNTTPIVFNQSSTSGGGGYSAGTGLNLTGKTFSVNTSVIATVASPALTGNPTAPTASPGDNDTSIATTAFVAAAAALSLPLAGGTLTGALTLAADPASSLQAATKQYVDGLAVNLGKRGRVRAATTANITISTALNNADTLDGVTLATGDLVLVKNQSAAAENGIYVVGVSPARFSEYDTYDEHPGALLAVAEGSTNADTLWLCTSNAGGTLNSTSLAFSAASSGGGLLAANNLSDLANAGTARTNLGVAIGTDVQAYDAQLSSLIRQNSQSTAYTTVLTDGGKHLLHPSADTTARTFTIDSNANVAYPIGTAITFVNQNAGGIITIAITSDTMRLAGAGTTGSRTLAANGVATALKITSTEWIISGTGLT